VCIEKSRNGQPQSGRLAAAPPGTGSEKPLDRSFGGDDGEEIERLAAGRCSIVRRAKPRRASAVALRDWREIPRPHPRG